MWSAPRERDRRRGGASALSNESETCDSSFFNVYSRRQPEFMRLQCPLPPSPPSPPSATRCLRHNSGILYDGHAKALAQEHIYFLLPRTCYLHVIIRLMVYTTKPIKLPHPAHMLLLVIAQPAYACPASPAATPPAPTAFSSLSPLQPSQPASCAPPARSECTPPTAAPRHATAPCQRSHATALQLHTRACARTWRLCRRETRS